MHPAINHLVQLQELTWIRKEKELLSHLNQREPIDEMINVMTLTMPAEIRPNLERLVKLNNIIVTPVSGGACSACGIKLSSSLAQAVRAAKTINVCPNCTRILYCTESSLRNTSIYRGRIGTTKSGISRFSCKNLMLPKLKSTNKNAAICEMADNLAKQGFVDNPAKLAELAIQRECIASTWVENGLAFPHVRGIEGGGITLSMGLSAKGIDFDGPDQTVANIITFVLIPTAASRFYLELLASVIRTFSSLETRKAIMKQHTVEGMWETLLSLTSDTIK